MPLCWHACIQSFVPSETARTSMAFAHLSTIFGNSKFFRFVMCPADSENHYLSSFKSEKKFYIEDQSCLWLRSKNVYGMQRSCTTRIRLPQWECACCEVEAWRASRGIEGAFRLPEVGVLVQRNWNTKLDTLTRVTNCPYLSHIL